MWRRLPEDVMRDRAALIEKQKQAPPRWLQALIAVVVYAAVVCGILYLNHKIKGSADFSLSLQNASLTTLIAVFIATAAFMYFLMVKSRKAPVIFICYDCDEAFHIATTCPACNSGNVSDIRFAEWIEQPPA